MAIIAIRRFRRRRRSSTAASVDYPAWNPLWSTASGVGWAERTACLRRPHLPLERRPPSSGTASSI